MSKRAAPELGGKQCTLAAAAPGRLLLIADAMFGKTGLCCTLLGRLPQLRRMRNCGRDSQSWYLYKDTLARVADLTRLCLKIIGPLHGNLNDQQSTGSSRGSRTTVESIHECGIRPGISTDNLDRENQYKTSNPMEIRGPFRTTVSHKLASFW